MNLRKTFKFNNIWHLENWIDKIINSGAYSDYLYGDVYDKNLVDNNVWAHFLIENIELISGGCNKHTTTNKSLKTPFYEFTLFNPVSMGNNCFFKCLDKILGEKVDIKKLRKQYNLPTDSKIDIQQCYEIMRGITNKIIYIIDYETNEELNNENVYILIKDEHYYVVEKFTEVMKKDRKTKRGLLTFDFETRQTEEYHLIKASNTKSYILKDTICCMYYKEYNGGKNENGMKNHCFTTDNEKCSARQFLDWLNLQVKNKKTYNIIAHNGGNFDFYFLISSMTEQELKDCEIQMRGTTIISINYKGHLFKDSYCFMTFSLETLSNNFKIEEGKLTTLTVNDVEISSSQLCFYKPTLKFNDFLELQKTDVDFWKKYVEYCVRDCVALYQIWEKFTVCVNELIGSINPYLLRSCPLMSSSTIGSHSKKILNTLNKKSEKYDWAGKYKKMMDLFLLNNENKTDMEKYDFLNKFKRGGISHCNKAGLHTHGITSVDIASQYPASLIHSRIPVGYSHWTNEYEEKSSGFYKLNNLVFDTEYSLKPIATKKSNGVLEWNTKQNVDEIFIDGYTIQYLKNYYGLKSFDVNVGLVSYEDIDSSKLFGKYVNTFYNEKKRQDTLKKSNDETYNPALRETIKLYLNSLTGKLVEDPERHFSLKFNDNSSKLLNGVGIDKEFNQDKFNDWIIAGIMVYSYSKRLLFEYIRCLPNNSNSVIHIETDGIYFDTRDKEKFEENLKDYDGEFVSIKYGDDLGNVKIEKSTSEGQDAYFLGKKFYCITDTDKNTYKIKGIPQSTIDDEGNKIKLVDEELYKTIYSGESVLKHFKTLKRNLFTENTKITAHTAFRKVNPNQVYKKWE